MKVPAVGVAALTLVAAGASQPSKLIPVRVGSADEIYPVAGNGYLAWARFSPVNRFEAFVRRGQGRVTRLSSRGTVGIPGGITRHTVAYVQLSGGASSIRLYDLRTHKRRTVTVRASYFGRTIGPPRISGNWLFYSSHPFAVRFGHNDRLELHSLSTRREILVAEADGVRTGQLAGRFAVWQECTGFCRVYRYDLDTRTTEVLPDSVVSIPEKQDFAPSVTPDGTVYFVHVSGDSTCAADQSPDLLKGRPEELPTVVASLPRGFAVSSTYAVPANGKTTVYLDGGPYRGNDSNIYAVVDRG